MKYLILILGITSSTLAFSQKTNFEGQVFLGQKFISSNSPNSNINDKGLSELGVLAGGKFDLWNTEFSLKGYARTAQSSIFMEGQKTSELQNSLFPQQIIARDVLKSHHKKIRDEKYEEATLYQASFSWGDEDMTFTVGRFPIIFGHGAIINPINPLNHNPSISPIYIDQVNDGAQIEFHTQTDHRVFLYLMGDKRFSNYDEDIIKTVLLRGELTFGPKNKLTYLLGEDQKRHKYGFEWLHSFEKGQAYTQGVRYSQPLDQDKNNKGLFHYLVGASYDVSSTTSLKAEIGKFQLSEDEESQIIYNYLPFEDFISLGSFIRHNNDWNSEIDLTQDPESNAFLYRITSTYNITKAFNISLYQLNLSKNADTNSRFSFQNSFEDQFGLVLRGKF